MNILKNIKKDSKNLLIKAFRLIYTSRLLDEKIGILLKQGKSSFHMSAGGHEAIQVAAGLSIKMNEDWVFPYYRDQALCLSMGMTIKEILLGFLGKKNDPSSGGKQMPNHFGHKNLNIISVSSTVGSQFTQAVGTTLANKYKNKPGITIVCSGEGGTSQGEFYEALNWASIDKLPVIFLIQNNNYAISVPSIIQKPDGIVSAIGNTYKNLKTYKIDGCNFIKSMEIISEAYEYARNANGPVLIEADVVRLFPHSSSDNQNKYRLDEEIKEIVKKDPLFILKQEILDNKYLDERDFDQIKIEITADINKSVDEALMEEDPSKEEALQYIYSSDKKKLLLEPIISDTKEVVLIDAINIALTEEMKRNENIVVFGEDVAGGKGGVFQATRNLTKEFGIKRCFNTQLAEASIIGVGIGMALKGLKPVVEIQFGDYIWPAMSQIRNELSTMRYRSNNNFSSPLVIRVPVGGYIHGGLCHSQSIEAFFAHIPGIYIVAPSNSLDAYGLLKTAMRCNDPVLFLEHKFLYRQKFAQSCLPEKDWTFPIGKGKIKKIGNDITIITYGSILYKCIQASNSIELNNDASIEIIDMISIQPIDWDIIFTSVKKTGKVLIVHEDTKFMGLGAEIVAEISKNCYEYLDAPVERCAGKDSHIPFNNILENEVLPQIKDIELSILKLLSF